MRRQSLSRRVKEMDLLRQELAAWESDRNEHTACIQWQFTTEERERFFKTLNKTNNVGQSVFDCFPKDCLKQGLKGFLI